MTPEQEKVWRGHVMVDAQREHDEIAKYGEHSSAMGWSKAYAEAILAIDSELTSLRAKLSRLDDVEGVARTIGKALLQYTGIMTLSGGEWESGIARAVVAYVKGEEGG